MKWKPIITAHRPSWAAGQLCELCCLLGKTPCSAGDFNQQAYLCLKWRWAGIRTQTGQAHFIESAESSLVEKLGSFGTSLLQKEIRDLTLFKHCTYSLLCTFILHYLPHYFLLYPILAKSISLMHINYYLNTDSVCAPTSRNSALPPVKLHLH